jgi:hypothetical protein
MYERRQSNIMVHVIDHARINADMTAYYRDKHPDAEDDVRVEVSFHPYGYVDTPQGMYVLCNEGVGNASPMLDSETYRFDGYVQRDHSFAIMPEIASVLTAREIREHDTGERVPLSEFIRRFGARLDQNHDSWVDAITRSGGQVEHVGA